MNGLKFCAVTTPARIQSTYSAQHKGMLAVSAKDGGGGRCTKIIAHSMVRFLRSFRKI